MYGLSDRVTGFGGLLVAEKYNATNLGLGFNTPLGGFSADVTHSQSRTRRVGATRDRVCGFYSKTINATETSFTVVGYRYSTEGYRTSASISTTCPKRATSMAQVPVGRRAA